MILRRGFQCLLAACALSLVGFGSTSVAAPASIAVPLPDRVEFNRDIRPVLSDNCFACHGFDKAKRKADLRLDTKEGLFTAIDGNTPVVPGKPDQSELYKRITHHDPDEVMPPKKSTKSLTERQKQLIRRWIEQGATWQGHWSYINPVRPAAPKVDNAGFVRNPVDAFILDKLNDNGLKPSGAADRVTLIRRLSFDLTGLPPTPAEVDAFVGDKSPDAYEKLVDRLLASPRFGEQMAMHWLDLVRYADSIGYHSDNPRPVTPYRDYVIQSFNQNKPFNVFTVEQIAGDLFPNTTMEQKVASAYHRLLQTTEEGGAQPKEYENKYLADRVRNVSTVWMGQTMGCSECHDHKFDPISAKDFYAMEAFFADIQEPPVGGRGAGVPVIGPMQEEQVRKADERIAALKAKLDVATPELAAAQAEWEKTQGQGAEWKPVEVLTLAAANGTALEKQPDGVVKAGGTIPATETYTVTAKVPVKGITGIRLEALPDPAFAANGPGASNNGNFVLTEFTAVTAAGQPVKFTRVTAGFSQQGWDVAGTIDGKKETGWAVMPEFGKPHTAIFETAAPVAPDANVKLDGGVTLTFILDHQQVYAQHNLGKFRLSATNAANPAGGQALPVNVQGILALAPEQRSDQQKNELAAYYRTVAPLLQPLREELAAAEKQKADLTATLPTCLVTVSGPPREIRIKPRGNWLDDSGPVVGPAIPEVMGKLDVTGRPPTRMDLANWLVSRENPLTARVFVNRHWKLYFGQGISKVLDDLGAQGEWPTHPELLDWLAVDFMETGWDVKRAIKTLVMSGTYRQASRPTPEHKEKDPYNRMYARQARFRLEAEMVRDNALYVSGLLVEKLGGKSVFPYQPAGYWYALNFPPREWQNDTGENLYRRGLYTHWQRSFLHPSLLAFDAPSREEATCERSRSNIPQQALVLLNDPTYVEAARTFAERIIKSGGATPDARLKFAFRTAVSREPTAEELKVLAALLEKHGKEYATDKDSAMKLVSTGARPVPQDVDAGELAAWTSVSRVILNLHETITRE